MNALSLACASRRNVTRCALALGLTLAINACSDEPWNRPYPASEAHRNILFSSFQERPNHLDPVQSYSSNEVRFIGQIYEPPLQYHYLLRPYTLMPLTASKVPQPFYLDADGGRLADDASLDDIAISVYEIRIQPGIRYQPHPAFARDANGDFRYLALTEQDLGDVYALDDFTHTGTRELTAEDYVYQIKRLAHPRLHSPIFGLMSDYIVGLSEYAKPSRWPATHCRPAASWICGNTRWQAPR